VTVPATDGIVVVDKSGGMTSHDVVARVRRLAATRRVGHAGTLDPMATGVLVVGIGRATRLLGYLSGADKDYDATIRLGVTTTTDDAEGEPVESRDASDVDDAMLASAVAALTGSIEQVPASVSAVKVGGVRAYKRAREGETVELAPRSVVIERFGILGRRGDDVDVRVTCSTGTYVRALARDLGAALGVGAHLTALRRTRVGAFGLDSARTLDEIAEHLELVPLAEVVAMTFPRWDASADDARRIALGQRLAPIGLPTGPVGAFGPDGAVVALVEERNDAIRPTVVFTG
jgi:tRNA pseudouridine55 synthase